jgi:hypothetical protein
MRHRSRHLALLLLLGGLLLQAAPTPVRAATMVPPTGYRPKDFAFVKRDGVYHLFYIRHSDLLPPWATEVDFGHAVSTDLYHWTQLTPVMPVDPGGWDNLHVWAPHVVSWGGLWWMFYTGLSDFPGSFVDTQRIGVAVSSDLSTWNRVGGAPVWSTESAPWAWWAPLRPAMACRDPFVMPDPNAPGQWLMYYTASPADDTTATLVGVARSAGGDPLSWQDEKPLWITHRSYTFNDITESPHLFQHDGRWYLFITTNSGQPLTFYTSADPLGDPAAWTYRGRLRNMLGYDTSAWGASEELSDGAVDLFAYVNDSQVDIKRIAWSANGDFSLVEPSPFHMVRMEWTVPVELENRTVGLRLISSNGWAFDQQLVGWMRNLQGQVWPAPLDSLYLPDRPDLPSDTVLVPWFTRRWLPGLTPDEPVDFRVGMMDGTAQTDWLRIHPNSITQPPPRGPGGFESDSTGAPFEVPEPTPPPLPEDTIPVFGLAHTADPPAPPRVLTGSPIGPGPAIAFELAEGGGVRAEVFDLQGRRLVTLADRRFAAGAHVLPWDGRDAAGGRLARGLYFVRLAAGGRTWGLRVLLDR